MDDPKGIEGVSEKLSNKNYHLVRVKSENNKFSFGKKKITQLLKNGFIVRGINNSLKI